MGYFDKDYLEHHQILGAKWGKKNGPPYPLGSGDHSSAEKKAAAAAGVKVGKDSGKGSIDNVKKKKKAPLTEEEKRLKAEEARLKGDSKNINKYMDKLTTDELRDAQTRAQIKKSLSEEKQSKAEKDKRDAMLSGDKEKVKEYATKMTYNELSEAMNKVDLMQKLNYEPPKPTTMDKINNAINKVDTARDWMEKSLKAYDALAAINNTFNKDSQWPRAQFGGGNNNNNKDQKKEDKIEKLANMVMVNAQNNKAQKSNKENQNIANRELDQREKEFDFKKKMYNDQQKAAKEEKREAKSAAKEEKREVNAAAKEEKREDKAEERYELNPTFNKYKLDYEETETNNRHTNWQERALNDPNIDAKDVLSRNRQLRMTSKEIDAELSANEQAMFKAISNPNSYDSNGNFNWDSYRPPLIDDTTGLRTIVK